MQNIKPLYIPKTKKFKGMTVYCSRCNTNVSEICKDSGKPLQQCVYGDKHFFKIYIHVPGTTNTRKTKKVETRDLNEAIKIAIDFEKEIKGTFHKFIGVKQEKENKKEIKVENENIPYLLTHAFAKYIGWLHNEGVPAHMKKERSSDHIKDVGRALTRLVGCLKDNGIDMATFSVDDINDEIVGLVFSDLEEKKYSNRSFNKFFSYYTSFLKWYADEFNIPVRNWFERVKRKKLNNNPEAITRKEYEALLNQITPENGMKEYAQGVKPTRNMYRPFLKDGIRLALETGRRREEIVNMRWDSIKESDGNSYIVVEDYKVNRIQNRINDEEKKLIYIPITQSLQELLDEMGHEKYRNSANFILAPENEIDRKKVMSDILSKGFSHFYNQLNTGRSLTFKCLRKTYITNLQIYMGANTRAITGHSDDKVIETNYIDKKEIAKAAKGFKIFSNEKRSEELENIRKENELKQKNREM